MTTTEPTPPTQPPAEPLAQVCSATPRSHCPRTGSSGCARILYGNVFEFVVIAVILANAASLATLTFAGVDPRVAQVAHTVDFIAIIFYTVELVLRDHLVRHEAVDVLPQPMERVRLHRRRR